MIAASYFSLLAPAIEFAEAGGISPWIPGVPEAASLAGAAALAVSIGLQNFPEGTTISMPLRREGAAPFKSFFFGQLSAVVESIAGVGVVAVTLAQPLLLYALAFAAGAMIFVVVEELIPESQRGGYADLSTMSLMVGFAVIMTLDVAFG